MKSIKFSDHYVKMPHNVKNNSIVKLIEVLNARFEDLHESFIEYDARTAKGDMYPLPKKGDCLVLLFLGDGLNGIHPNYSRQLGAAHQTRSDIIRGCEGSR